MDLPLLDHVSMALEDALGAMMDPAQASSRLLSSDEQ